MDLHLSPIIRDDPVSILNTAGVFPEDAEGWSGKIKHNNNNACLTARTVDARGTRHAPHVEKIGASTASSVVAITPGLRRATRVPLMPPPARPFPPAKQSSDRSYTENTL